MALALEGIRILDLSMGPPGGFCTMIMADLGADVLKIEPLPQSAVRLNRPVSSPIGEEGRKEAAYSAINRNKRSIGLNLKLERGRNICYKLCEKADVFLEGFRPGVAKRLGVEYETIKRLNPRIIYCSITGYGQDGPYRDLPGHDINYISVAGILDLIGERGGHPVIPPNLIGDIAGGSLHSAIGVLAALVAREQTGKGQYVDISMTDSVISLWAATSYVRNYFFTRSVPKRGESSGGGGSPFNNVYETKDGKFVSIGCVEPFFWQNLCREIGREDFIPYQKDEGEKRDEILSHLKQVFLTKTRDEWFELLRGKDIPVSKVYTLSEVVSDPQVLHRKMVIEIDHPEVGKVRQVGIAIKLSETPGQIRRLAPVFGEDTEQVLRELGYGLAETNELRQIGAIG